jgi:spore maturation protein CgeB
MRLAFVGPLWPGSTTIQRLHAFERMPNLLVTSLDTGDRWNEATIVDRVAHHLRRPIDWTDVNGRVMRMASEVRPDVMFFDNVKIIQRDTLRRLRDEHGVNAVFYTPDNVIATHNSSRQLEASWPEWRIVFTTKSFNTADFTLRGVKTVHVIGNAFDEEVHRPMDPLEVGPDFERFDAVFAGYVEPERRQSINELAASGATVIVYGDARRWGYMHRNVTVCKPAFHVDYARAMHTGKVALCFLRKINRDTVTTRSIEIPAMARAMAAERTREHDQLFEHSHEYFGFSTTAELIAVVRRLVDDAQLRDRVRFAGRARCFQSGYSTVSRAREMVAVMKNTVPELAIA